MPRKINVVLATKKLTFYDSVLKELKMDTEHINLTNMYLTRWKLCTGINFWTLSLYQIPNSDQCMWFYKYKCKLWNVNVFSFYICQISWVISVADTSGQIWGWNCLISAVGDVHLRKKWVINHLGIKKGVFFRLSSYLSFRSNPGLVVNTK